MLALHEKPDINCAQAERVAHELLDANSGLRTKIRRALMSNDDEARAGLVELVKFLMLTAHHKTGRLTPAHRVDLVWHELILFTRAYAELCRGEFGRFIHHQPSNDHEENRITFNVTLSEYRLYFGQPREEFWGLRNAAEAACGNCEPTGG
jgi:hypothetical protein